MIAWGATEGTPRLKSRIPLANASLLGRPNARHSTGVRVKSQKRLLPCFTTKCRRGSCRHHCAIVAPCGGTRGNHTSQINRLTAPAGQESRQRRHRQPKQPRNKPRGCFNAPRTHRRPRHTTPSYRTPMRYPPLPRLTALRCGIHGGVSVAGRTWIPAPYLHTRHPRHTTPSYRTPMRYPPLPRLTAPRCGTHGGERVAGRTFDDGPAQRKSVAPTVTPPWIPVSTGKTKEVVVVPHSNAVPTPPSSYRTPMRYPWWGKRGWAHLDTRTVPPHPSSPTHHTVVPHSDAVPTPPSSYRTPIRYPHHPVLPHPDAVSMVGPGVGTPSTTDRLDVRAYPPPSPHHGYRFPPVRRRR